MSERSELTPGERAPASHTASGPGGAAPEQAQSEPAAPSVASCPSCGEELLAGARFCEACGAAVVAAPAGACERCGSAVAADGYCTGCGHRALGPVEMHDVGSAAYATHRGRRHHRNEDAGALASTSEGWTVLVVVDGVSNSPNPHLAAAAATRAAAGHLDGRPFGGLDDLAAAVSAAHDAASAVASEGDPSWPDDGSAPACTIVVGVATTDVLYLANVGDARGYHLRRDGDAWLASCVTTDDSVAAQAVAAGIDAAAALAMPGGHAITAWLGRDAPPLAPHMHTHEREPGDVLLLCSDGLWNYAPTDASMAELLTAQLAAGSDAPLGDTCAELVSWANDQGGADNICVAMTPPRGDQ